MSFEVQALGSVSCSLGRNQAVVVLFCLQKYDTPKLQKSDFHM